MIAITIRWNFIIWNEPEYHADRARLVEAMLKEQYRYADLMPRPVYMG